MPRTIAAKLYLSFLLMAALMIASAAFILHSITESRRTNEIHRKGRDRRRRAQVVQGDRRSAHYV
jgi:hypothetical protein